MELSIVLPAFNEAENIEKSVTHALEALSSFSGEVVVVNDGSQDETGKILAKLELEHPGRVVAIHHATNLGYGTALRNGFEAAKGEWVAYTDADNQFDLMEIQELWEQKADQDMVVGFRMNRQDPWFRKFAAASYNFLVRLFFGLRGVRDIDCALKLFHRSVFKKLALNSNGFLIDGEILVKAHRKGLKIKEVGVHHFPRKEGTSTVKPRDVFRTLKALVRLWIEVRGS